MARGTSYQDLADMFGVSLTSVGRIVEEFVDFVVTQYGRYVKLPETE